MGMNTPNTIFFKATIVGLTEIDPMSIFVGLHNNGVVGSDRKRAML